MWILGLKGLKDLSTFFFFSTFDMDKSGKINTTRKNAFKFVIC